MGFLANKDLSACDARSLHLRVALQTKVIIPLDQHLGIERAVGVMASRAALAQRFVFKNERPGLVTVALGTRLVDAGEGETTGGFHDVPAVWIMALHAIHLSFNHGMMLRQVEIGVRLQMAAETSRRVSSRIDNEFAATAADGDMFATGAMAGFTTGRTGEAHPLEAQTRVRAGWKNTSDVCVALVTGFVADECRPLNRRWHDEGALETGAGNQTRRQQ